MQKPQTAQSGQATTEYIIVLVGFGIALAILTEAMPFQCENARTGQMQRCESVLDAVQETFHGLVTDVTMLLNLPS